MLFRKALVTVAALPIPATVLAWHNHLTKSTPAADDPLSIAADPAQPLGPGKYLVVWRTAGDDGHAVRGRYAFTVGK